LFTKFEAEISLRKLERHSITDEPPFPPTQVRRWQANAAPSHGWEIAAPLTFAYDFVKLTDSKIG
jgi:hypothetical protein